MRRLEAGGVVGGVEYPVGTLIAGPGRVEYTKEEVLAGNLVLDSGGHIEGSGFCLLEAVAYVAGEEHGDRPEGASRNLADVLRRWSGVLRTTNRQKLRVLIPLLPNTSRMLDHFWAVPLEDYYNSIKEPEAPCLGGSATGTIPFHCAVPMYLPNYEIHSNIPVGEIQDRVIEILVEVLTTWHTTFGS